MKTLSLPASPDEGQDAGDPASWLGVRHLTRSQIDRLARECVRQVKERGPFLNLSDFVNRRLAAESVVAQEDALLAVPVGRRQRDRADPRNVVVDVAAVDPVLLFQKRVFICRPILLTGA